MPTFYLSVKSIDGQTNITTENISVTENSSGRSLQSITEQAMRKFAASFEGNFIPENIFSFQPVQYPAQDETEYLLQSPTMKSRLLAALERSNLRQGNSLPQLESNENSST